MALDLHISGPGLDLHRLLEPGEPALVLGRDTDCAVCLPDPERNISRRHLSVWNDGGRLHFHVLSVVNGVDTPAGELPPGARGVLAPGDELALSAYRLTVVPALPAGDPNDPWAEFERQAARMAPPGGPETVPFLEADDPFGDWGFHSTFGPGSPGGALQADALQPAADLQPFLRGLGMEGGTYTHGELETIGRLTRTALQGLLQAAQAAAAARHEAHAGGQEAHAGERTRPEPYEPNPLHHDSPLESKLDYLFRGQGAAGAPLPPDVAVAQLAAELTAYQQAMDEAARAAVRAVLEEFEPEALKKRLLGGGARMFESARAWEAFARDYAERQAGGDEWVRKLLDRHFARAYARALVRAKRNTTGRNEG